MWVTVWLSACGGDAPGDSTAPVLDAPAGAWALVHVDVLPMTDENLLEDRTVVIDGDRIFAIVPSDTRLPSDLTLVEGNGGTVIPGLVDFHVHNWYAGEHAMFLANGITTVRNMFGDPLHLEWQKSIAAGDLLAPTIVTSGPIVDGSPPLWPGSDVVRNAAEAAEVVQEQQAAGYEFIKVYSNLEAEPWRAILAEAEARGLAVDGHVPRLTVTYAEALASTQRTIEHLEMFFEDLTPDAADTATWAELPKFIDAIPQESIDDLAELTAAEGTYNTPTLDVYKKFVGTATSDAWLSNPEMAYVDPEVMGYWKVAFEGYAEDTLAGMAAYAEARVRWTAALHDAGAPLLVGTDTTNAWVVPGWSLHEELALMVEAGLTPYEALRAATVTPAEVLLRSDEQGTVEEGKRADLVLLQGDPRDDIRRAQDIVGVVLRGEWLPQEALQAKLDLLAEANAGEQARRSPTGSGEAPPRGVEGPGLRRP